MFLTVHPVQHALSSYAPRIRIWIHTYYIPWQLPLREQHMTAFIIFSSKMFVEP